MFHHITHLVFAAAGSAVTHSGDGVSFACPAFPGMERSISVTNTAKPIERIYFITCFPPYIALIGTILARKAGRKAFHLNAM